MQGLIALKHYKNNEIFNMAKGRAKELLALATKLGGIDNVKSYQAEKLAKELLVNKAHNNIINPKKQVNNMLLFQARIQLMNSNIYSSQLAGVKDFFLTATSKEDAIKKIEKYKEFGTCGNGDVNTNVINVFKQIIYLTEIQNFIP